MTKFYDTNALLLKMESLFDEHFALSSVSLSELESIKTSTKKDADVKYSAQKLLRLLDEHRDCYDVHIFKRSMLQPIFDKDLIVDNDTKILATAFDYDNTCHPDDTVFVTNDLWLKTVANLFFGEDSIESVPIDCDTYTGFKEVYLNDEQMAKFYSDNTFNMFDLHINEYLIIHDLNGQIVDKVCWTGAEHRSIGYYTFGSKWLGNVKPMKGDIYQALAADSLVKNKITMLRARQVPAKLFYLQPIY